MANALRDFDITNPTTLDILNSQISDVTNDAFSTPYMALERVRKVLSYFSIFLPAYRFMDSDEGNTVFQIDQFGKEAGWNLDAKEIKMEKEDSGLFLYFEWGADVDGLYTIFSEVVTEDDLNDLLDAFDSDDEDPADHSEVEVYIDHSFEPQEDETMNEDKNIDVEVPKTLLTIKTKFAKTVDAESETDRENEMASGRPLKEGMMDMNKRYFKKAIAERKALADKKKAGEAKKDQPKTVKEARESEDNDRTGSDRTEHSKFTAAVRKLYPNAPKGKSLSVMKASAKKAVADMMKEENLQELSKDLIRSYKKKAPLAKKIRWYSDKSMMLANAKLNGTAKVPAKD